MNTNDYYNDNAPSRVKKNATLYKRIDADTIDSFDMNSNSVVLDGDTKTIDVEKLKSMLDKQYREPVMSKKETEQVKPLPEEKINLEETREYNLDDIIAKAKESSTDDYKVERLKKLSDTNISILDDLDIKSPTSKVSSNPKELVELIDTINLKEQEGYKTLLAAANNDATDDALDMLSELKGDDEETKVMGALEIADEDIPSVSDAPVKEKIDDVSLDDVDVDFDTTDVVSRDENMTDSIELTTTQIFTKDDFEDFDDLKEAAKPKIFVKLLIFLIVIAVIIGTVFVLNKVFDLGWFNFLN